MRPEVLAVLPLWIGVQSFTLQLPKTHDQRIDSLETKQDDVKKQLEAMEEEVEALKNKIVTNAKEGDIPKEVSDSLDELTSKLEKMEQTNAENNKMLQKKIDALTAKDVKMQEQIDQLALECKEDTDRCGPPPEIENMVAKYTDDKVGSKAMYTCKPDFHQCETTKNITCQSSKQWDVPTGQCDQYKWINPEVPFSRPIPCGEQKDIILKIDGTPTAVQQMTISVERNDDILFHILVRFVDDGFAVMMMFDGFTNNEWMNQRVFVPEPPFRHHMPFSMEISLKSGFYKIKVDGHEVWLGPEYVWGGMPNKISMKNLSVRKVEILI